MAGFCNPLTASRTVPLPAALARKCRQPYRADKNDSIKVIDLKPEYIGLALQRLGKGNR